MPKQDERVRQILDLINRLFGDTSVDKQTTLGWMEEIECAVADNVSALKDDIRREEEPS